MTTPDLTIYPDETAKLALAQERLSRAFEFSAFTESTRRIFESAAQTEFGKAGFSVHVEWKEIHEKKPDRDEGTPTGVWLPTIEIVGRTTAENETDHDRYRWGVVKGLADGQAGYVREDGRKTEDPLKKLIL
jgi:hypothetical protein